MDRLRFSRNVPHNIQDHQLSCPRGEKWCEVPRRSPGRERNTGRKSPQMVDNWSRSNNRHRRRREERIPSFLLWRYHAQRVEGEAHCSCPLGWSNRGGRFQVPTQRVNHPNGVTEVAYITVLIPHKDLDEFERQLTSVIGFTPEAGPDYTRIWHLSVTTGSHSPHLILRTPRDTEEEMYVKERKGSIYKVAFQLTRLEGELLSI